MITLERWHWGRWLPSQLGPFIGSHEWNRKYRTKSLLEEEGCKQLLSLLPSLSGGQLPGILEKECICIFVPKISYLKMFLFYILFFFFLSVWLRIDFLVGKQRLENIVLWPSSQCVCRNIQSHPVALWLVVPFRKLQFVPCVTTSHRRTPCYGLLSFTLVHTRNLCLSSLYIFSWVILQLTSFPPPSFLGSVFWYYTHVN